MSLHEEIVNNLSGYSKAMYSTWFFYRPSRILLDAGEGVSTAMENFVFAIERVFLSHGHYDHIGGLPGLLQSRRSARGDKEKPLEVYYPDGDELIELQRRYVESLTYRLGYALTWHPVEPDQRIELSQGRERAYLAAFRSSHGGRSVSLGFKLTEERKRLRPEYAALAEPEIAQWVRDKRERLRSEAPGRSEPEIGQLARSALNTQLMETYEKVILAYSGDTMPLDAAAVRDAEVLLHEATFLDVKDREAPTHATAEEAIRVAVEAKVHTLALFHISGRYPGHDVRTRLREMADRLAPGLPIVLFRGDRKFWVAGHPDSPRPEPAPQ